MRLCMVRMLKPFSWPYFSMPIVFWAMSIPRPPISPALGGWGHVQVGPPQGIEGYVTVDQCDARHMRGLVEVKPHSRLARPFRISTVRHAAEQLVDGHIDLHPGLFEQSNVSGPAPRR